MVIITKELESVQTALLAVPIEKLDNSMHEVLKFFLGQGIPGMFINFSKSHKTVLEHMKKAKINTSKLFIVDTFSAADERKDNILFVNSPSNLTDIGIAISQFIKTVEGEKFVVIDSLTNILAYNDADTITRFVRSVIAKTKEFNTKTAVLSTKEKEKELLDRIYPFFDKVIKVD